MVSSSPTPQSFQIHPPRAPSQSCPFSPSGTLLLPHSCARLSCYLGLWTALRCNQCPGIIATCPAGVWGLSRPQQQGVDTGQPGLEQGQARAILPIPPDLLFVTYRTCKDSPRKPCSPGGCAHLGGPVATAGNGWPSQPGDRSLEVTLSPTIISKPVPPILSLVGTLPQLQADHWTAPRLEHGLYSQDFSLTFSTSFPGVKPSKPHCPPSGRRHTR